MLHLTWSLLNIALFAVFMIVCYRATKLIRQKLGMFAACIFVFGLLSFTGNPGDDGIGTEIKKWRLDAKEEKPVQAAEYAHSVISKKLFFKLNVVVSFVKDSTSKLVPLQASSTSEGVVLGFNWVPGMVTVQPTSRENQFMYTIAGSLKWRLLGLSIYTHNEIYSGVIVP